MKSLEEIHPYISIHALLAESDNKVSDIAIWDNKFLSTLSLRRATMLEKAQMQEKPKISIHALLAESDRQST